MTIALLSLDRDPQDELSELAVPADAVAMHGIVVRRPQSQPVRLP